ncbi:hypothetical protein PQX77_009471 [Marasmius sp. AFHP31]|nr:hypothetical protein PQX77_009471 [Marasmius sp. AFHP31]
MSSDAELKRLEQTLKWTFADESRAQGFLAKKGRPAQQWLDRMQQLINYPNLSPELRPAVVAAMLRLSKNSDRSKRAAMESSDAELKRLEQTLKWTFADKSRTQGFLAKKGRPAQQWLDRMQQLIDYPYLSPELRPAVVTAMLRLSKNSGLHPTCLSIQNVKKIGKYPIAAGGFGDVWKGTIGDSIEPVCLKVVKVYMSSNLEKLTNEYQREAILWRQMKHPNVLPFYGIYQLEFEQIQQLCLISPWMEKGNLVEFLKTTKREDIDHYALVFDVASGLAYLHSKKIVHSDLKGVNILITSGERACIADFGLSRITDSKGLRITTSATRPVGTARWLAPELLVGSGGPSKESDVYAFACVCCEIFTGLQPFPEYANEMTVAFHVAQGKRPSRPEGVPELSNAIWALMNMCWETTPSSRPTASHVLGKVEEIASKASASDWSESLFTQVQENVKYHSTSPASPNVSKDIHKVHSQNQSNSSLPAPLEADIEPPEFLSSPTQQTPSSYAKPTSPSPEDPNICVKDELQPAVGTIKRSTAMLLRSDHLISTPPAITPATDKTATSTVALHDIKNGHVGREIREKEKDGRLSGWLSRWTSGSHDKDKDKDHGHSQRERSQLWQLVDPGKQGELAKLIGSFIATSPEDWALALNVCGRASASDSNAKEASRVLRRAFKYGQPQAQLNAARLCEIMLRNSTDAFINQSTSRKFMETLEELASSSGTNHVVKERALDVLAAARYASGGRKDTGLRGLWKKVKPHDKPDEGIPSDSNDAMFNEVRDPSWERKEYDRSFHEREQDSQEIVPIPAEEDIRRLFQECVIGKINAWLLTRALEYSLFDETKRQSNEIIRELWFKCIASQELIAAQIPWASGEFERNRRKLNAKREAEGKPIAGEEGETTEERLLGDLLNANEELMAVLRQYEDYNRTSGLI